MHASEIVELLKAEPVVIGNKYLLKTDYTAAFATDLMSDALAMIQFSPEATLLLTGLCNSQTLRTAEMLDMHMIVFVRDKHPVDDCVDLAREMELNLFTTNLTMYEACGVLYGAGMRGIQR